MSNPKLLVKWFKGSRRSKLIKQLTSKMTTIYEAKNVFIAENDDYCWLKSIGKEIMPNLVNHSVTRITTSSRSWISPEETFKDFNYQKECKECFTIFWVLREGECYKLFCTFSLLHLEHKILRYAFNFSHLSLNLLKALLRAFKGQGGPWTSGWINK